MASVEKIMDGMIRLLQRNVVARTPLTADCPAGQGVVTVDDTILYEDGNEILMMDNNDLKEYHSILRRIDSRHLQLTEDVQTSFLTSNGSIVQKTVGNVPLYQDMILFGDREVIPNVDVAVTVEPLSMGNEWVYLQGGLSEEFKLQIMIYLRLDDHERALRAVVKYADNIYRLLMGSIHMDVVMDEQPITANLAVGDTVVPVTTIVGWPVDTLPRYEIQDELILASGVPNVEVDFRLNSVTDTPSPRVTLNRALIRSYTTAKRAKLRRRVEYIYDSRVDNTVFGEISKGSTLYKAAKLSWFGKQTDEWVFPQLGRGGPV